MNLLFGRPLATSEERAEHIGPIAGIPIFGLDALSSAAYGPEAALTLLIPLGLMGVKYIVPVSTAIVILLVIVYFSYRQTIEAYPHGGGSYTVASQNLGEGAGLLAAAALMIDYVLTAAVGISAGVGALISAVPSLQPHTLELCLIVLAILTIVNMRGVHDTGVVFMIPTYLFTATLLIVIAVGGWQTVQAAGHPHPVTPLPAVPPMTAAVSWWLLLKVFSSGCTAMTGVEAVSNGVMAFREPTRKNAKTTLTIIIALLAMLLLGIALLCRAYGIAATDPGGAGYESVLSMLTRAVMGHGWFYYLTIVSVLLVLALSANTAFADFPRLTRAIARRQLHAACVPDSRAAAAVLVGHLCAGGADGAAADPVWRRDGPADSAVCDRRVHGVHAVAGGHGDALEAPGQTLQVRMMVNGLGAVATGITTLVVLVAKFVEGAWITALLVMVMILLMRAVKRHYVQVNREIDLDRPIVPAEVDRADCGGASRPLEPDQRKGAVVCAVAVVRHSLRARVHERRSRSVLRCSGRRRSPRHCATSGRCVPKLVTLNSPYRYVLYPVVDYVLDVEKETETRKVCVLVPELVVRHWWEGCCTTGARTC